MRLFSRKSEVNSFVIFSCMISIIAGKICRGGVMFQHDFTDPGDLLIHVRGLCGS